MHRRVFIRSTGAALVAPAMQSFAQGAADARVLRILLPFAAGGPSDQIARSLAQALSAESHRPVVVENRPGADGIVAARAALASPSDGATLLYVPSSLVGVGQLASPAVDVAAQFEPVAGIGRLAFGLFVTASLPVKSVQELVTFARNQPGRLNFASSTLSELMAAHQFMRATGVTMTRVPYKGAAQAMPDLLEGRVQLNFGPLTAALPSVRDGRLRLLAVMLPQRTFMAPEVPTLAEAGYPGVQVPTWQALFAPGHLHPGVLARLAQDCQLVLEVAELRRELEARALAVEPQTPQQLQSTVQQDRTAWSQVIREYQLVAS